MKLFSSCITVCLENKLRRSDLPIVAVERKICSSVGATSQSTGRSYGATGNTDNAESIDRSSLTGLLKQTLRALAVLLILLASIVSPAQTGAPPQDAQSVQPRRDAHVIMISIDGLVPDYYTEPARLGLRVTNLTKMKLGGAYADGVEGVFPTVTYPSHTSLITGVRPATHGIYQNRIFEAPTDPQTEEWYWFAKDLKSETLWSMAKKAGLVTANVGWPVTAGADIDYSVPEIKDPKEDPAADKSRARVLQYSTPGLLAKALSKAPSSDTSTDGRRTAISEYIINEYKPNLMLIHLLALDGAHHTYGPRSPEAIKTAEQMDEYVGRIIEATRKAGTFDQTTFFLVSDHGFASVNKKFEPNVVLVKEKLITLDASGKPTEWKAAAWPAGGSCAIVLRDPNDKETASKVTEIFNRMAAKEGGPLNRVLNQAEIKRLGSIPTALLMLDAGPGFAFDEKLTGPEIHDSKGYRGTHGHLPSRAELRSALIIYGAGARVGARMPIARMIDIGPTAAAILGLRFAEAEGSPIAELIKPGLIPPPPPKQKKKKSSGQ
ncbi:MAG TPA: ectonucleotide pyrophosphatase/phosphodiesterase [Blastocatellia bacterium]|nr:ectonucleotide pyrophosphatase/phosphodiesterase [Blastocatellia bacterium]